MADVKTAERLSVGTRIEVKPGVTSPEFPDVPCEGWSGTIVELIGRKSDPKYVVEWDERTIERMPEDYRDLCEENGLFFRMACFAAEEIESAAE